MAIERLKTGIAFYQGTSDVAGEAIASIYLGDSYRNLGDAQQSAGAHLNALILARSSGSVGTQDQAMAGLASTYDRAGSTDSARNVLDQRLTLAMSGINTPKPTCLHFAPWLSFLSDKAIWLPPIAITKRRSPLPPVPG